WRTSSMGPSATIVPRFMIATRSHRRSTSSITWLENTTVCPPSVKRSSTLRMVGRDGVDGLERLVEEEDAGAVQQGGGQRHLLAHAVAVVDDERAGRFPEPEHVEQLLGPARDHSRVHAP